ncbi:DNA-binding protein [Bergeriella denitrificans]|uniref:DNA-binding protein n=2 Tax=Bergeriella denitrificans TaxID=494 RepID=A0A378UG85_BERDE|nr:DNA-binding protein [Bergeriella denitrificans]
MRMWGDYERGISQPKAEVLFLFKKIGIDVDYVMGEERIEQPSENLNEIEQELLALFRRSSELGRAVILSAARGAEKKEADVTTRKVG